MENVGLQSINSHRENATLEKVCSLLTECHLICYITHRVLLQ